MLGIGYGHPTWNHGTWQGEEAITSESWKVGDPSAFLKSPDSATRNVSAISFTVYLQPARSWLTASVKAPCSTHTSPE